MFVWGADNTKTRRHSQQTGHHTEKLVQVLSRRAPIFNRPFYCDILNEGWEINKTISDGGITVDFWIIKVHTSN